MVPGIAEQNSPSAVDVDLERKQDVFFFQRVGHRVEAFAQGDVFRERLDALFARREVEKIGEKRIFADERVEFCPEFQGQAYACVVFVRYRRTVAEKKNRKLQFFLLFLFHVFTFENAQQSSRRYKNPRTKPRNSPQYHNYAPPTTAVIETQPPLPILHTLKPTSTDILLSL